MPTIETEVPLSISRTPHTHEGIDSIVYILSPDVYMFYMATRGVLVTILYLYRSSFFFLQEHI